MNPSLIHAFVVVLLVGAVSARADVVLDWNSALIDAIRATPAKHNPGNSTRGIAMMNGAIYDVFQAVNRTHAPFMVNTLAPGANLDAAVAQAAYRTISDCYGEQQATLDGVLAARLGAIPDSPAKMAGIALGNLVAQQYITTRSTDGFDAPDVYTPTDAPGHWSEDPLNAPQKGWGQYWGNVGPWAMNSPDQFDAVIDLPTLGSQEYIDAFNQVKDYGVLVDALHPTTSRTADQEKIALFWAYDRPGMGPPPVLFVKSLDKISAEIGSTTADRARLFALASVAMADAAIAAWDVKYETDFWRPITAIRADATHDDDNAGTTEDSTWKPLGAPGDDPNSSADDFTPPFPAYTSGHATMGGALFKSLELFYGTNDFNVADSLVGNDPVDIQFALSSQETNSGGPRTYTRFTQTVPLTVGTENSPEGENAMSRIYLGIHWLFDETDGMSLGNHVAEYVAANHFQAVPEPGTIALALFGSIGLGLVARPWARR